MVPALLILTFAVTLKNMTGMLGAAEYVFGVMQGASRSLYNLLPGDHIPCRLRPCVLHRHELGYVRHPDPDRDRRIPRGQPAPHHRRFRVPCGRRHGRPLLADLRYDDHGLRRCAVRPSQPCFHADPLRSHRRRDLIRELRHRRIRAERCTSASPSASHSRSPRSLCCAPQRPAARQ